jgi:pilus assembly protein CpaF
MQDLFVFKKEGLGVNNKVKGRFNATGIVPKFADKLKAAGIPLNLDSLDESVEV